jgi:hypothetical protein
VHMNIKGEAVIMVFLDIRCLAKALWLSCQEPGRVEGSGRF